MTTDEKNEMLNTINIYHNERIAYVYEQCKHLIKNNRDEDSFYNLYLLNRKRIELYDKLSEIEDLINHEFIRKD